MTTQQRKTANERLTTLKTNPKHFVWTSHIPYANNQENYNHDCIDYNVHVRCVEEWKSASEEKKNTPQ